MNKEIIGPLPPVYEMRAPYKMKVRKTAYLSYKDYCEYLKREGRQYEVFGRTILAHLPNLPGIRINVDDFNLIYPEFRSINKLCYSNGEKIWPSSFDTLGSSLKLSLVCIEFQENNIPIPLFETDTIWYEWYYYPKIHERRAQPIPRKVEREGYQPDRYQTCYAGGEIAVVQTVFVIDDVVVCEMELINCTDRKKQLTIACHDQRGIGIEKTLSISPPSFEARKQKDILIIKYGSLPLTNTYTAVYSSLSNKWEIQESDDVSYRLVNKLVLLPNEKRTIHFMASFGLQKDVVIKRMKRIKRNFRKAITDNRKEWNDYFNYIVPRFECSDERYEKLYYWTFYVHKAGMEDFYWNKETPVYVPPRKGVYAGGGWWDNGFHSIIEKWLDDTTLAKNNAVLGGLGGGPVHNGTTCLAYWDYYLRTGDKVFLKSMMDFLKRVDEQFEKEDGNNNLLPANKGRTWDYPHRYGHAYDHNNDRYKWPLELVDTCSLVCCHRKIMSMAAKELGDRKEMDIYQRKAEKTAEAINRRMWDEKTGFYYDVVERDGEKIKGCKANSGFIPFLAGIPDQRQAKRLIQHLTNPDEFWTPFPVPTISKDSAGYSPSGYWYGCVWSPMNWQIIEGLVNYAPELAAQIIHKWVFWATVTGYPTNMENHSALGEGLHLTMQGWGGLVVDLMIRRIMGFIPRADDKLEFWPLALDQNWDYASWGNFNYKGKMIDVIWNKPDNRNPRHAPQGYTVKVDHDIIYNTRKPEHVILSPDGRLYKNKS